MIRDPDQFKSDAHRDLEQVVRDLDSGRDPDLVPKLATLPWIQKKVEAIEKMPMPANNKQLQAFLGMCNYYRVFIRHFAQEAEPLYDLLRKNTKFIWTERQT